MRHRRFTRTATLGLAVVAVAAPAAGADQDLRSPDAADIAAVTQQPQDSRSPDTRDIADGRGTFTAPAVTVVRLSEPSASAGGGFDWGDAGIGAGGILALTLIIVGGSLMVTHRRHGGAGRGPAIS